MRDATLGYAHADPLSVQRKVILGLLFAIAVGAWAVIVWQRAGADMHMTMTMASSTMGMRALLFLAIWVIMMLAMMLPTAAPMIFTFHKVQATKRLQHGDALVSTSVFVAAYILVWTLTGAPAYAGALAAETIAASAALSPATAARIGGVILIAAGIYQFTPLKSLCLSKCRTPVAFITTSWRDGVEGALRMGLLYGAYCLGCCWLLFVILFPLGVMSLGPMAAVTLIIFAEKTLPWPRLASFTAAFALVLYGALVIASPQLLPTFVSGSKLPFGGEVRSRESSAEERQRWLILLVITTVLAQAALLIVLLHERRRRMYAEVLIATIAHELSQPLGAILSNSEAAKELLSLPRRIWLNCKKF